MDPINIFVAINLALSFVSNLSITKESLTSKFGNFKEKPKSYLQSLPLWISSTIILFTILAIFKVGTFEYDQELLSIRLSGLICYIFFTWLQIGSFKNLGKFHSTEVVIKIEHQLVTDKYYRWIRHPQYLFQILIDLGAAVATLSYLILPLAIVQIYLLIKRAQLEESLLEKHFGKKFLEYKSKTGFLIPFLK